MIPSFATVVGIALAILLVPVLTYGIAIGLRLLNEWQLRRRSKGRLVLTFDDGPSPTVTAAIRQLLRQESVKASFFVIGFRSEEHTALIAEALSEGHDVGSHSFFHLHGWRQPFKSLGDVLKGFVSLRQHHPVARFFRPPYGKATLLTYLLCWAMGYRAVYWTIDCKDVGRDAIREPEDIVAEFVRKGGGVVLLHDLDLGPTQFPDRLDKVLAICDALVASAKSRGMPVSTLSEVFL
jgi:peptidoglycan/xylan/chitin deacetylase (PgdA/CDA1 family)